jgi:type VI secretion system protein ImpI
LAIGLRLQITDTRANATQEHLFAQFPVRIGRNPLNDLRLLQPFVSQFHAVLELQGSELMLRDLGSKNGTLLAGARAPAHKAVELASSQGCFAISSLSFQAKVDDIGTIEPVRPPQKGLLLGGLFAAAEEIMETMALDMDSPLALGLIAAPSAAAAAAGGPPRPSALPKGAASIRPHLPQYVASRGAVAKVVQGLSSEATGLSPTEREQLFSWARQTFPGLGDDPEFHRLLEHYGIAAARGEPASFARRLEYVALQAVRELAVLYVPGAAPIGTEEELVRFLTKVRDTLDMFFKCFIPLRDGYRQFKTDMDIRDAGAGFDSPAGAAQRSVDRARTPRVLAELLLNWSDDHTLVHKAVEGAFADLMIHQLALLSGIMRGVKSLLEELSPASVDIVLAELRKKKKTGVMWGPYRFRELWKAYLSRHADLADGEKQVYSLVFGADFARAYAQLSGEAGSQAPSGGASKQ